MVKLKNNIINYTEVQIVILCIFIKLVNEKMNSCYAMEHILKRSRRTGIEVASYSKYFACNKFKHKEELEIFLTLGKDIKKASINLNIRKPLLSREQLDEIIEFYGYSLGKLSSNEIELYEEICRKDILSFNSEAVSFLEKLKITLGNTDNIIIPDIELKPITEPVQPVKEKLSVLSKVNESLKEPSEIISRAGNIIEYTGKGLLVTAAGATALHKVYQNSSNPLKNEGDLPTNNIPPLKEDTRAISKDKINNLGEKTLPESIESTSISDWWPF